MTSGGCVIQSLPSNFFKGLNCSISITLLQALLQTSLFNRNSLRIQIQHSKGFRPIAMYGLSYMVSRQLAGNIILITALGKRPKNYLLPLCSAQPISSQKPKRQTVSFQFQFVHQSVIVTTQGNVKKCSLTGEKCYITQNYKVFFLTFPVGRSEQFQKQNTYLPFFQVFIISGMGMGLTFSFIL